MWSFPEIMGNVILDHVSEVLLSEQDHLVQAFGFDGQDEPFGVRAQIRRHLRKLQAANTRSMERLVELLGVERIAVVNQDSLSLEEAVLGVGEIPGPLDHLNLARIGVNADDLDFAGGQLDPGAGCARNPKGLTAEAQRTRRKTDKSLASRGLADLTTGVVPSDR
jgi:hypothetical protein